MTRLMIAAAAVAGLLTGVGTAPAFADDAVVANVTFVVTSSGLSLHGVGKMLKPENGPYDVYLAYAKSGATLPAATRVWTGWADDLDTRYNQMLGGLEPSTTYAYRIYATDRTGAATETTSGTFKTGKVYYVDGTSGDDANTGLTEAAAVKTPEQAVALAKATKQEGNEIRIAPGRYVMSKTLGLAARYALVGTGATADDVVLDADHKVDQRIVNANVQHVTLANLTFANARMETFNTYANWTYPGAAVRMGDGGGSSWPGKKYSWVTNCVFTANTNVNTGAGALYLHGGCKVVDCRFENNYAGNGANNGCSMGGAVFVHGGVDQTAFERCTFAGNYSAGSEGALCCSSSDASSEQFTNVNGVVLTDCVFTNNAAAGSGGGFGGKVVLAKRCTFVDNSAARGGVFSAGSWKAATQWSSTILDSTFRGNRASLHGGVYCSPWYRSGGPAYVFSNCVFEANYAAKGYSAFALMSGTLLDCVFRGNRNDDSSFADNIVPGSGTGVGLFCDMTLVRNCVFSNNVARGTCLVGGAYGGRNMRMEGCTFVANELRPNLPDDVAEKFASQTTAARSILYLKGEGKPALTVRNTLFANNTNFCGYGCAMRTEAACLLTNDNVTIVGNRCVTSNDVNNVWWLGTGAGVYVADNGTNVLRNCIVLDNRNIVTDGLHNFRRGMISFANCLEDGATMNSTDTVTNYPNATMKFKDAAKGDYTPLRHSTAHNAGLLLDWMTGDARDVLGNKRVFDDAPDIGAFENVEPIPGLLFIVR